MVTMANNVLKEVFATDVFHDEVMQEYLPKKVYSTFKEIVENGGELDISIAKRNFPRHERMGR